MTCQLTHVVDEQPKYMSLRHTYVHSGEKNYI
jgi:hypothetical protein